MTARLTAEDAEFVLQADNIELTRIQEVRAIFVLRQVLIVDLQSNGGWIVVDLTMIRHRDDSDVDIGTSVGNRLLQIGCEGRDATASGERIADKCQTTECGHSCTSFR